MLNYSGITRSRHVNLLSNSTLVLIDRFVLILVLISKGKVKMFKNCPNIEEECGLLQSIGEMLLGRNWAAGEFAVNISAMERHPH